VRATNEGGSGDVGGGESDSSVILVVAVQGRLGTRWGGSKTGNRTRELNSSTMMAPAAHMSTGELYLPCTAAARKRIGLVENGKNGHGGW
jgi:hypothetical protein